MTVGQIYLTGMFLFFVAMASARDDSSGPLRVVPSVDLHRYAGTWYEIARLPNKFQKDCAGEVTATYTLLEDGEFRVVNRCRKQNDEVSEAEGRAKLADENGPSSKLKVRFAPAFLSFLPFVWGNYWIIELAPDYSHVVVGEPERKYLWIMARTPTLEEATYKAMLDSAAAQGYDISKVVRTPQVR